MNPVIVRRAVAGLAISAAGLLALQLDEGFIETARIPTKGDVMTYGYGTTTRPDGSPVRAGDTATPEQAAQWMRRDVTKFENVLKSCVHVELSQAEFNVYTQLAYNIGAGKEGVKDGFCWAKRGGMTTIPRLLNQRRYSEACDAILLWNRVGQQRCDVPGNRVCWGLWQRRLKMQEECKAGAV